MPYLSKPDDTFLLIRGQVSNILRKFNIFYKKEEVLDYLMYKGEKVNSEIKISDYFTDNKSGSAVIEGGVKKAPFFKIRKPLEVEPIKNDTFNSKFFIKGQSREILEELMKGVDFSKVNGEIFKSEIVVFDYVDDRYDVIPEQKLNLKAGGQNLKYNLNAILAKE